MPTAESTRLAEPALGLHNAGRDQPAVRVDNVSQVFETTDGSFTALLDVSLTVEQGEFVSIVGPSGCGKSTLIGMISGLAQPRTGTVEVLGTRVTGVDPRVGVVFQRDALLPWRTAVENVALALRYRGRSRRDAREVARDWLARVGLQGFEDRYPHQLSGGMRKRVSIAATLCYEPALLLMDEPFSALDVQTRNLMENDLLDIWSQSGQSVLFITHDLEEAVGLSDRVIVMSASPGTVLSEHKVHLERPRDLLECKLTPDYTDIYSKIWSDLKSEVLSTYRRERSDNSSAPNEGTSR